MKLSPSEITELVLTYNEEANIGRCLERLTWLPQVVVVDSNSTDSTTDICARFENVRLVQHPFESHAQQSNAGLEHISTPWVLSLDADYILSLALIEEIQSLEVQGGIGGYEVAFDYWVHAKALRTSLLPPRCVLYRRERAHYVSDGHAHRVKLDLPKEKLDARIAHDDRKSIQRWCLSQISYAEMEAKKLRQSSWSQLSLADKIRKAIIFAPLLVFLYCYIFRGLFLDGRRGLLYSAQRVAAELLLSLWLIDLSIGPASEARPSAAALNPDRKS